MKSQARAVYPVRQLREQVTELEAAVLLVLSRPKKQAVHRIRTSTRRIEAQLELLDAMAPREVRLQSLRGYAKRQKVVRKALNRLRKAAGRVRDLDVQRELIRESTQRDGKLSSRAEAKGLRRTLKKERGEQGTALRESVEAHLDDLTPKLEALLDVLEPLQDLRLTEMQLIATIEGWFSGRVALLEAGEPSKRELHAVRKSSKLARYMAESGGVDLGHAAGMARQFEILQQAGGDWHDLLALAELARQHLGRKSALGRGFAARESSERVEFERLLAESDLVGESG